MVAEGVVLRRVEHLEQRRRGVAAVVGADLVDLVEQHDRVHRAGLLDGPDDAARQRADVRAPVATDLGLVADAAEGDADELAAHGAGDGLAQRGLADAGRTGQQDHRAGAAAADHLQAALGAAGADGEVLHDPLLDLVEAVVVGVQHLAGARRRRSLSSVRDLPTAARARCRARCGSRPASGFCSLERSSLSTSLQRGLADVVGQVGGLDPGAVVVGALGLALAELLADRGELLAQQELALATSPSPRGRPR